MTENLEHRIKKALDKRRRENIFRTLPPASERIDNGSSGSRLLTGNNSPYVELENVLAKIFSVPRTLLFTSGYSANLSILAALPGKGDTIIYDELSHACIKDGARLSMANRFSFAHNDLEMLDKKLKKATGVKFVIVEAVYSMDGDSPPFPELINLCQQHDARLIVDEAHSTGVYGENGAGLLCELGLSSEIFARIHTFGKAMGCHGACIAGDELLIDYLINFARPFIYTTALPPHSVATIASAFDYLGLKSELQLKLKHKIALFNQLYDHLAIDDEVVKIKSESAIQAFLIPGNKAIKEIASSLRGEGFEVFPIVSPTVKEGSERLRICLHTFNSDEDIFKLVKSLVTFSP